MARKVYTYNLISDLRSHPEYNEFSKFPHITATVSMKSAIEDFYGDDIEHVTDIHSLITAVTGKWSSNSVIMEQYINLGAVIRSMSGLNKKEQPLQEAFLKSRRDVLKSIRSLAEADIFPEDFQTTSTEEKLFLAIWKKVEASDLGIGRFRAIMDGYSSDIATFTDTICEFDRSFSSDTIVLHGFYYITAIQERIFDLLEKAGKTLIFLGNIDSSLNGVNEIWYKTFSAENGFPSPDTWTESSSPRLPSSEFGRIFEKENKKVTPDNIKIIRYRNEAEFITDVRRIVRDGYGIFSTDTKKTETVLKEIFPEKFKSRHLLSYPVGQYFYSLHSLWDSKTQTLTLSAEDIQTCLSSGWVICDGKNGRDYTHSFELIKPYFTDCRTVSEWEKRILLYRDAAESFTDMFESHISSQKPENALYHRIMANPFLNLSCFTLNKSDVIVLFSMIEKIIETAKLLFGTGSEIDIESHFTKIQQIIRDGSEEAALYNEEKAVIEELSERLANPHLAVRKCLPEDISDAVMLIIGGGILDEDNAELTAASDERFVKNISQIEPVPIDSRGKLHLCLCDENRLPGSPLDYTWPLCSAVMERILDGVDGRRRQYLKDMISVKNGSVISNRYLFYTALQNMNVELSWIAEENGKTISESPYIRILNKVFGCPIFKSESSVSVDSNTEIESIPVPSVRMEPSEMKTREMVYDALLCPWKYIYGYMSDSFPSYRSDFHYRFVLSGIISGFSKASGLSADNVSSHVLERFPYLKTVEKRQIRDFTRLHFPVDDYDYLDDVSYSGYRLMPHFLNKTIINDAASLFEENNGNTIYASLLSGRSKGYTVCLYCQYRDVCIHAEREGDEE